MQILENIEKNYNWKLILLEVRTLCQDLNQVSKKFSLHIFNLIDFCLIVSEDFLTWLKIKTKLPNQVAINLLLYMCFCKLPLLIQFNTTFSRNRDTVLKFFNITIKKLTSQISTKFQWKCKKNEFLYK